MSKDLDSTLELRAELEALRRRVAELEASLAQAGPLAVNQELEAILDSISDGLLVMDREWRYTYFSETAARIIHVRREDMLGRVVWDLFPHARGTKFYEYYHRAVETGEVQQFTEHYPEPLDQWLECRCYPSAEGLTVYFRDVTERIRAEQHAAELARKLDAALMAGEVATFEWSVPDDLVWGDRNFARMFGIEALEAERAPIGRYLEAIHPDDRRGVVERLQQTVETGAPYEAEYRVLVGEQVRWVVARGTGERDATGRVVRFPGAIVDITARKRVELALRESEERFRSVVENMSEGLMLFDAQANLVFQNAASLRIHGFDTLEDGRIEHDALAATWLAWDESGRAIGFDEWPVSRVFRHERFQNQVLRVVRPDTGREFVASYNGSPIYDAEGTLTLGFITLRDITEQVRATDALQRSERRLRAFFESDLMGAIYWTTDGRITGANDTFLRMIGYTRDDLASGRIAWAAMTPPEYEAVDRRALDELRRTGVDRPYEKEFIRKDGTRVPTLVGAAMVDDTFHDGVAFALDLTEKWRAEQNLRDRERELRQTSAVLNAINASMPVLVVVKDLESRVVLANPAMLALVGRPDAEVYGRTDVDWFGAEIGGSMVATDRRVIETGESLTVEELTPDGRTWLSTKTPWRDERGLVQGVVAVSHDITERKQSERAMADARHIAEEANRQKDDFLAMLGHELRNPLAPIRTATALLRHIGPSDPALQRARDVIDRQVSHMTRLIDDLLDVSRVARGKVTLRKEPFDLTGIVQAVVEDHRPLFEANGVSVSFIAPAAPVQAFGDSARVAQIVSNLVVNANKFTNRGGSVAVEVRPVEDHEVEIRVRDTGIGMEPAMQQALFEPFAQADRSLARSGGGLGLGLALVKGLTELHGGSVTARSEGPGTGAEFVVSLPIVIRATASDAARAPAASGAVLQRRILVVEDNVDAAEMLQQLLEADGHLVAVAHSGERGLDAARVQQPHVVICDIGLPGGMNGYDVARALRAAPHQPRPLLIALSGYGQEEDKQRALEAGFDWHLTKPVDPEVLRRRLEGRDGR
jgi:PAS domain S-box-containing protein